MQTDASVVSALTVLSEEEIMFRDAVAAFAQEEVRPRVMEMEKAGKIDPALLPKYFELGLMGIEVPEQYGGAGGNLFMVTLAVEEISKFGLATRAEKRGDRWILNGQKLWITDGAEAGIFVVFANADPSAGYRGITAFIVERDFAGFRVGKKEDKLGIRASSTTELLLDNCEVPDENVLGPVGQGYKIAINTLNGGRIGIGAQMIGVAQGALNAAIAYVNERRQFGKPLSDFQAIQFQLAQAATELEAARLMVYNAARLKDAGNDIAREGAMAKLFSSQVCERVTSLCVELFGGYGYTKDYPVEKFYRDAKIGTIYEGTSNMQLQTIAKAILK